ncbi:DUF6680 family protein [Burkholderia cenocepacia]|uniref:DUF6680 family protein n=1 Tax=Burkholderia cenocepacia TaxID=95486 RepID=UPI0026541DED|nr:DUF6680 family protein [Burkholderia cenocepacia]MDN7544776.1 hypothetical protein [Burkholderia cenocepacia]MDN7626953.1 hypothetical protein [Burkholderia cenocepacia]
MGISDWAIVAATLAGPVLAVQAQKWVERAREKGLRKNQVFQALMATRANRVDPEHVRALNLIDLVFYGRQNRGRATRSKAEQAVIDAWHEYHDHLNTEIPEDAAAGAAFFASREELFVNLLAAMAAERRYLFDRVRLKKGGYTPMAHGKADELRAQVLMGAAEVLAGKTPIRVAAFEGTGVGDALANAVPASVSPTDATQRARASDTPRIGG